MILDSGLLFLGHPVHNYFGDNHGRDTESRQKSEISENQGTRRKSL